MIPGLLTSHDQTQVPIFIFFYYLHKYSSHPNCCPISGTTNHNNNDNKITQNMFMIYCKRDFFLKGNAI